MDRAERRAERRLDPKVGVLFDEGPGNAAHILLAFGKAHQDDPEELLQELDNFYGASAWFERQAEISRQSKLSEPGQNASSEEIAAYQTQLWRNMQNLLCVMNMGDFITNALVHGMEQIATKQRRSYRKYKQLAGALKSEINSELERAGQGAEICHRAVDDMKKLYREITGESEKPLDESEEF